MSITSLITRLLGVGDTKRSVQTTVVDPKTVDQALQDAVPGFGESVRRIPLDGKYHLTDRETFREIASQNLTDLIQYDAARYDCENYALLFAGQVARDHGVNGCGVVVDWPAEHAYNIVVSASTGQDDVDSSALSVYFYEPQNDRVLEPGELGSDDLHQLGSGRILI